MHLWYLLLFVSYFGSSQSADSDVAMHNLFTGKSASMQDYQRKVASYWTDERKKAAKPMKIPTLTSKKNQTGRHSLHVNDKESETLTIIDSRLPSSNTTRARLPSTRFQATITAGKVYFTSGFYDYVCSGSVVSSPSESLVITAAHCVYDLDYDEWSTNWMFVPAHDYLDQPYGSWTAKSLYASKGYTNAANFDVAVNYDVGFAVMLPLDGKRIAQVVGSYGIAFNFPRTGMSYAFGYPVDIADGEIMSSCMGRLLSDNCDDSTFLGPSRRCGMTGGSSGGPWLQRFNDRTGLGTITSLTSFSCYEVSPYVLYGPPFNNPIKILYNSVRSLT